MPAKSTGSDRDVIRERLVQAKGHIEGIIKMVDNDKEPSQVLRQILAVDVLLDKTIVLVIEGLLDSFLDAPRSRRQAIVDQIRDSLRDLT